MLVFFHERTCGRCRRAEGFLAQVLQHRGNHQTFRLQNVDVTERPDLGERFLVRSTPTLIVVDKGSIKARLSTVGGGAEITDFLSPWLK
jgi:thioredoxin-like negative regulator of GroEL